MCVPITVVTYLHLKFIAQYMLFTAANIFRPQNIATKFRDVTAYFASKGKACTALDRP
jgi:hypothetical protein